MDRTVLKNRQYRQYGYISRYTRFPFYYHTKDEKYVYGTTAYLKDDTAYSTYVVQRNDTFDSLALKFYNNPTLFWVICSFNHIQDPYSDLVEGATIKIPAMSNLKFDI